MPRRRPVRHATTATPNRKPLVWLWGWVRTPPFSKRARIDAGTLLARLQQGENIGLPHSRPMPMIGKQCHELRIPDEENSWRVVYRIDKDAIVILEVFSKKDQKTPQLVIDRCRERIKRYEDVR
jgi:phage-related protein